jgi:hypothetical protein
MWSWFVTLAAAVDAVEPDAAAPVDAGPPKYAVGLRYKYMWVPDSLLDIWFFSEDEEGALEGFPRPNLLGHVGGLEFSLQPRPNTFVFYVEYFASTSQDGYFDDRESPADHNDGDWVEFQGTGMVALGADYLYELPIIPTTKQVWPAFIVGGGLGFGIVTGDVVQWHPGGHPDSLDPTCMPTSPAPLRTGCEPDGEARVPPVLPVVDILTGFKLHIRDRAWARVDFGVHDFLAFGAAAGGEF